MHPSHLRAVPIASPGPKAWSISTAMVNTLLHRCTMPDFRLSQRFWSALQRAESRRSMQTSAHRRNRYPRPASLTGWQRSLQVTALQAYPW